MNTDLTVGKAERVLWRFCIPLFGSILFQQLYHIADSWVANIKAVPLGAGPLPGAQGECSPAGGAENIRHKNASLRHNNVVPSSYPTKGNPSRRTGRRSFG